MGKGRAKAAPHLWNRQEYLYQSKVYEYGHGGFDPGPPASPVTVRVASPEDLARFDVPAARFHAASGHLRPARRP